MYFSPSKLAFINVSTAWPDCAEVTEVVYEEISAKVRARTHTLGASGNSPVAVPNPETPVATVDQVFQSRLQSLNSDYEFAIGQLHSTYPLSETISWTDQVREARAHNEWIASGADEGSAPETPFIDNLIAARAAGGITDTKNDLTVRIVMLHGLITPPFAQMTGIRHVAERALDAAKVSANAIEALNTVAWNFAPITE